MLFNWFRKRKKDCYIEIYVEKDSIEIEFQFDDKNFDKFKLMTTMIINGLINKDIHKAIIDSLQKEGRIKEAEEIANARQVLIKATEYGAIWNDTTQN